MDVEEVKVSQLFHISKADNTMDPDSKNDPESTGDETTESLTDDDCCPICLGGDPETMVSGTCQHNFCIPCLERVLTVPIPGASQQWQSVFDSIG